MDPRISVRGGLGQVALFSEGGLTDAWGFDTVQVTGGRHELSTLRKASKELAR